MEARYIDHMGSDLRVVNAARVSFNKHQEVFDEERDTKLIKYLARNGHWTPFSHPIITLYEKIPIFVARQRFKHTVGFTYNEVSRRYVDDPPEFYEPTEWRTRPLGSIKQGSGTEKLPEPDFEVGYCINCGKEIKQIRREQNGGREQKYCSKECKYSFTNKHRNPYKTVFQNVAARAKREGKEWGLDFDTFKFPEFCPYLGIKLDYSYGKGSIKNNSPSFDRKDSSLGYVPGNVEIISNKANTMKSNATKDEQVKMAEAVLLRYKGYVSNYKHSYQGVCEKSLELYKDMINAGYSPEQARIVLPQSMYTEYYVTGSLAAWARAYKLRTGTDAQKEIKDLAEMWNTIIRPLFPVSWEALVTNGE